MHLPPDVVGDALGELGEVLLVLQDRRDHLLHPRAEMVQRVLLMSVGTFKID